MARMIIISVVCLAFVSVLGAGAAAQSQSTRKSAHARRAHARRPPARRRRHHHKKPRPKPRPTPRPTTTNTPSGCAGESLSLKADGTKWTCTFDDEFDASTGDPTALNRSWWTPQLTTNGGYTTGPVGSQVCYVDSPQNISVSGGALHLTVRRASTSQFCGLSLSQFTGGMVTTAAGFSQTYGRFEVRALLPQTTIAGLQETLWLWPVNPRRYGSWPASGEVDLSEFFSQYSNLDVPFLHYSYSAGTADSATNTNAITNDCSISLTQYNDYAVTWSPGSFTITINGTPCLTDNYVASNVTPPAPFDQPFIVALTQALGVGTNSYRTITPLPATTSIDYVRVWK